MFCRMNSRYVGTTEPKASAFSNFTSYGIKVHHNPLTVSMTRHLAARRLQVQAGRLLFFDRPRN